MGTLIILYGYLFNFLDRYLSILDSNSNSTFIALNLRQKTDSKAHHTKTLFNIQKTRDIAGVSTAEKAERRLEI